MLAVVPFAAYAQQNDPVPMKTGVQEDYDKFKDKTFVSGPQYVKVAEPSRSKLAWFSAMFSYAGRSVESPPLGFTIGVAVIADNRLFPSSGQRLMILADSKRVFDDEMTLLDARFTAAGTYQALSVVLPPPVMRKIAAAETVEAQIGAVEFRLADATMRDLRELDRRSRP
jgi:hypothetical protein